MDSGVQMYAVSCHFCNNDGSVRDHLIFSNKPCTIISPCNFNRNYFLREN